MLDGARYAWMAQGVAPCNVLDGACPRGIVLEIETKNLQVIAIICKGGHHRSVTAAELLRNSSMKIKHLTI